MPRLPGPEDYQAATPRAARGVTNIRPNEMGSVVSAFGSELGKMADEETKRLEEMAAQNAVNQIERAQIEMAYDPQNGYMNAQGNAVIDRQLLQAVPQAFDQKIESVSSTLKTPRAREYFQQRAQAVKTGMLRQLMGHVATQTEKAYEESDSATLQLQQDLVAHDPTRLDSALAAANEVVAGAVRRSGMTVERDTPAITLMARKAQGAIVVSAVRGLLANDNVDTGLVDGMLKKYEKVIPAEQLDILKEKSKSAGVFQKANDLAATAMEMTKAGAAETDVSEYIRKEASKNKELYAQTKSLLADYRRAHEDDMAEQKGSYYGTFMANKTEATRQSILSSPGFEALDGKSQAEVRNFMETELRQDISWRHSQAEQGKAAMNKRFDSPEVWARFFDLSTDPSLASMTPNQVTALLPTMGDDHVKRLLAARKQMLSEGERFRIDAPTIGAAVAGIKDKQKQAAAKGMIEANLTAWKEANPGRTPTPDEEAKIISNSLSTYVQQRSWWTDKETPVYDIPTGGNYYVIPRGTLPAAAIPKGIPKDFADAVLSAHPEYGGEHVRKLWNAYQAKSKKGN